MYSSHKGYSFANHVYLHLHWNLGMQSASWSWLHSGVYCAGVQQWILRVCHMAGYLPRLWTWWWHFGSNIALVFQSRQSKNFWYSHSFDNVLHHGDCISSSQKMINVLLFAGRLELFLARPGKKTVGRFVILSHNSVT
jgi:hypothetical protein